jgi:glycosyltransferase involved in cell wall biosynthesis
MRITYLASVRIPSEKASGLAIMRQCEAFSSIGHEVTLVRPGRGSSAPQDAFSTYKMEPTFQIATILTFPLFLALGICGYALMRCSLFFSSARYVFVHRHAIDVLYARDQWMLLLPLLFFRKENMVCEMHTMHTHLVTKFVCSRVGRLIVISEGLRRDYAQLLGRTDIILEPSGVDVAQFQHLPSHTEIRHELLVPQNVVVFGYIGKYTTMGEEKGVRELIEGFSALHKNFSDTHLLVSGVEKGEQEHVHATLHACNLTKDAYTLLPLSAPQFAKLAVACDVLMMNYPNTLHYREYMSPSKLVAYIASGRRIMSSDLPSVRNVLMGTDAHLFLPDDKDALEEAYAQAYRAVKANTPRKSGDLYLQYAWKRRAERIVSYILSPA